MKCAVSYVLQCCLQSAGSMLASSWLSFSCHSDLLYQDDSALHTVLGSGDTVLSLLPTLIKRQPSNMHINQRDYSREVCQQKSKNSSMFSTSMQTYDRAEPDGSFLHSSSSRKALVSNGLRPLSSDKSTPNWKMVSASMNSNSYSKLPIFATPFRTSTFLTVPTSPSHVIHHLPVTPIRPVPHTTNLRMTPIARTSTPKPCQPALKALQPCLLGSIFSTSSPHLPVEELIHGQAEDLNLCPACTPDCHEPLLDSRNFVHILRSSSHTCPDHAQMIKDHIAMAKQLKDPTEDQRSCMVKQSSNISIYDFPSDKEEDCFKSPCKPFTDAEIQNLERGVRVFGKQWEVILNAFDFHGSRTAAQLKDKYRQFEVGHHRVPIG